MVNQALKVVNDAESTAFDGEASALHRSHASTFARVRGPCTGLAAVAISPGCGDDHRGSRSPVRFRDARLRGRPFRRLGEVRRDAALSSDTSRLPKNVVTLGVASLLNDISSEMIFPLLPVFLTTVLGAGPLYLGFVEGAADSISALLRLPFGWLADRAPRKPLVVGGYAVANVVRPAIALATAPWHVLAIRLLDRGGKGMRTAPRDALLVDSAAAGERGRAFGFHMSMDHVGAVIGPLLATMLFVALGRSYRGLFFAASLPGLATVIYVAARVEETRVRTTAAVTPMLHDVSGLGARFWGLVAAVFLFGLGASTDAFLLLQLEKASIDVALLPFLWAALHVVKVASVYPFGRLSDRVGRVPLIVVGWAYYAAIYAAFALVNDPRLLALVFLAYGFFFGLTEGAERALVGDLVPAEKRGAAFGFYNAALGVTALPASALLGAIWEAWGKGAAFGFGASMAAVATMVLVATTLGKATRVA
jgi:MFS family permease